MIVIPPLHSVTSPTVGVGYLVSALAGQGITAPAIDLNIRLYRQLRDQGVGRDWIEWLFPFGERTYGGELLMSQACFERETDEVLAAAGRVVPRPFRLFLKGLGLEGRLRAPEADWLRRAVRRFLDEAVAELSAAAGDWLGLTVVATNQPATAFLVRALGRARPDLRLVLGGPHFHRENVLAWLDAFPEVDAVILGDGRRALGEWVRGDRCSTPGQVVRAGSDRSTLRHQPDRGTEPEFRPADWSPFDLRAYESSYVAQTSDGQAPTRSFPSTPRPAVLITSVPSVTRCC